MEKSHHTILDLISHKNNISKKEAVEKMERCFKEVSIETGINASSIIKSFYSLLNPVQDGICEEYDPEKCQLSSMCTYFNDSCTPIFVKDYVQINNDPDFYINNLTTDQLEKLHDLASHLYYNIGDSGLTDNSFDAIEYYLRKRMKKDYVKKDVIGALPIEKLREKLPYPMPSLDKIRPDEKAYFSFLANIPKTSDKTGLIWSEKLDGVSAMVVYKDGKPKELYTRGDGTIGGNISYLITYLSLPEKISYKSRLVIRGELVVKRRIFKDRYKKIYATGRSFITSQVNKGYITAAIKDIDFVSYEIVNAHDIKPNVLTPEKGFAFMSLHDFTVVNHGVFSDDILMLDIALTYRKLREESAYDIDGLVLEYNIEKPHLSDGNPEHKKAFKMQFEEQLRTTVVEDVDWDISRHGRYNPVAVYKPVYIDHVRIHRATAHNAAHVRDWNMGPGTIIKVVRSGDVIPQIKDVIVNENIEASLPSDTYDWYWKSRDIVLKEIDRNPRVQQKRILHFMQVIEIVGVGEKTVEKLFYNGFDNIKKIVNAKPSSLMKVKGIGNVMANKIVENFNKTISTTPLDRFLAALTVTDFKLSRKLVKEVLRAFPDILDVKRSPSEIMKMLQSKKIKGIGVKRLEMISTQFPLFREMLFDLNQEGITNAIKYNKEFYKNLERKGYDKFIKGKTFVLSGFMKTPYELEDYIYNNMGEVDTSVTSKTSAAIAYTNTTLTTKILKAREFAIPIYTQQEFWHKIGRT